MATSEHEKARNRAKVARWWERHRVERELARVPYYCGARRVVALFDGGALQWIEAPAAGEIAYWKRLWPYRGHGHSLLARWLASLPSEPVETVLFPAIDGSAGRRLAAFLMRDAVLREPTGRKLGRRTLVVRGARIDVFGSLADAVVAVGLDRRDARRARLGRPLPDGSVIL
jgi:hypothetical protein